MDAAMPMPMPMPMPETGPLELCRCPDCGLPAEVVCDAGVEHLVGVRCVARHWFFGLRDRLVA